MHYVYRLRSARFRNRVYVGFTADLRQRLHDHNAGCCDYTRPFGPWELMFYAAFRDQARAQAFESYLFCRLPVALPQARRELTVIAQSEEGLRQWS